MMRKRVLLIGAIMAATLTVPACGSKNITKTAVTVKTTTAMETTMEESTTEESTVTAEGMEFEEAEDLTPEQIKSLAEEIQAAVTAQDIGRLTDLSSYPVYVSLEEDEGSRIESVDDSMVAGEGKLFMEKLMTRIADVEPGELEVFSADVIMDKDVNITFNNVDGEPRITGINL